MSARVLVVVAGLIGSLSEAFSWEAYTPTVERGKEVIVVAPVFRERPLMEAIWRRLRDGKGGVSLVGSKVAPADGASFFLALAGLGAKLYLVDPWPLKPEGSFFVVDGRVGGIGPLVAGYADPEGLTREMRPEEVAVWWDYARRLLASAQVFRYDPETAMRLHVMRRLGITR